MIYDAALLGSPLHLKADLCIVGSGAGGGMAAMVAAEAGLKVVVLEAGALVTPGLMSQREEEMIPRLFWDNGSRTTRDRAVKIHQGRGVGGSTLHNTNLCKRIPDPILKQWKQSRGLETLSDATWNALYEEVETLLGITDIPREDWSRHNQLLLEGCNKLGWRGGGLKHNRTGCARSGFCETGCAYDAKNNVLKMLVPRAVKAGAEIISHCQAVKVTTGPDGVTGVDAVALDPITHQAMGSVRVDAPRVCLAASATATAALWLRSRLPAPRGSVGETLRIHPAVVAAGDFEEPVNAWAGIPQSVECTQFLELDREDGHYVWIVPAFAHPVGTATLVPGHARGHAALMERYAHLGVLTAMLHDQTRGSVFPDGDLGLGIDYWPDDADRRELMFGLWACAKLLFAAGARRVVIPSHPALEFSDEKDLERIKQLDLRKGLMDVVAVHPMGSVPMGDDPSVAAVGSNGNSHQVRGLWVADGSLFPTSIGGPPQLSIYALGLHVGRALVAAG